MKRRTLAAIVLVIVVGVALARVVIREDEEAPSVLVDERVGILHGVHFGDSEPEVRQLVGDETDDRSGFFPGGTDYTGPPAIPSPATDDGSRAPPSEFHHDDTAFLVSPTVGIFSMATLEQGARTLAGVGVGDDLELARASYDRVECGEAVVGEPRFGGETPTYRWCRALVGDIRVFFGAEPIESITLTRNGP